MHRRRTGKKKLFECRKIIQVAKETNVDAIHPGYGFLSENPLFVMQCEKEGITFIGPTADVMTLMGSKVQSRYKMHEAGIPVVPGSEKGLESLEQALAFAEELGYPLMLKASAGGGGIGMNLVHNAEELKNKFHSTKQQAGQFFVDDTLLIEELIKNPRDIEVQIAAVHHGNIVHYFEREG